ncbi:LLM class F420-dependent oxidoreductase [Leekyejoonella antrihumi]|uniref:LLM class F420-dependent oxidoreductase n=1 Tax=Leekyejoonella antrihumi TaxID=1660198 RepID=A0A563DYL9_9MICO|nr:LLM class F420-dependent oxidoreductase [Leekyejoonella antrihumi]TWP35063.1 LLM class F420-dependent oxidoreductase [Leekyejoonella antrihumi]
MRFGLFIPQGWRFDLVGIDPADHWRLMSDLAKRVDAYDGWESLWVYDHFHTTPEPSHEATHEAWSLMSAFAAVTGRVRLGQMCTCMSYRNPAYLAKVAATIDVISGGRVEMGIGGGWYEHEWRAYGYGFPSAGERLGRLREGVEIFRQMWTRGEATLDGKYYQVDGAICAPKPLQTTSSSNAIPIWIAGGGEKKTLRIAAEYADYTNFDGTPEVFAHKSEVLAQHCKDVGRDFGEITRTADFNPVIGETQQEVEDRLSWYESHAIKAGFEPERARKMADDLRSQPLVGTVEQVVERLAALEKGGLAYAISYFIDAAYDTRSIDLYQQQVIPHLTK